MWDLCPLVESDLDAVLAIETASFDRPWDRAAFLDELTSADAAAFLLKRRHPSEAVSAYICFRLLFDEMHLMKIAVAPDWRGNGLADLLLAHGLEQAAARGAATALLEVRPANRSALGLYRRFGFRQIGRRKQYYHETGEDALVLMKPLKEDS